MPNSPFVSNAEANNVSPPAPRERTLRVRGLRAELCLLAFCVFLFFWRLGDAPLFDLDEALYVTCSQQMVVSGDWITPRLNTRQPERPGITAIPFFEKPILVYWASAGSMRLLGRNLWAARLPTALAALFTTLVIMGFGQRWFTRRAGILAAAVFAANPMTLIDARQMTTDGLLVLWFTLAMFCFWEIQSARNRREKAKTEEAKTEEEKRADTTPKTGQRDFHRLLPLLFWFVCALAILTKGAVGLLLPLLIIGVFLLLKRVYVSIRLRAASGPALRFALRLRPVRELWADILRLRPLLGILLVCVIAAPWHLRIVGSQERDAQGRTWVMEYIQRQHIGRFKGLDTVHNQPLPSYFVYFLLFFFPWAGFAPAAFRLRRKGKEEIAANSDERGMRDEERVSTFLLIWFWSLFVFFSVGAAKLPTYIAPAYPAAALLVGRWLDDVLNAFEQREKAQDTKSQKLNARDARWLCRGAFCALFVGLVLLFALPIAPRFVPPTAPLPVGVIPLAWHLILTLTAGSGIAWICFLFAVSKHSSRSSAGIHSGIGALFAMMGVVAGILGGEGYTVLHTSVLGPYQQAAAAGRADARQGIPIVYYNVIPRRPSMNFYAGYSPFEHKEEGLLPFLVHCLPPKGRQADIVLTYSAYTRLLIPEISQVVGATQTLLQQFGPNGEWVLARVVLPSDYHPPAEKEPLAIK